MTDPLLQQLLLVVAREPWEEWYDTTRLVLADYLEERGDARAETLRAARVFDCKTFTPTWSVSIPSHPFYQTAFYDERSTRLALRRCVLELFPEADGFPIRCDEVADPKRTARPRKSMM